MRAKASAIWLRFEFSTQTNSRRFGVDDSELDESLIIPNREVSIEQGALYPALYRLEHKGLLDAEWGTSDNNRRARFYTVSPAGRKRLRDDTHSWQHMSAAMAAALGAEPGEV